MQVAFSVNRIYSTPPVLSENASLDVFSEARALSTVKDLTETIGYRLVSLSCCPWHCFVDLCKATHGQYHNMISAVLPTSSWQLQALTSDILLDRATKRSSETHLMQLTLLQGVNQRRG